MNIIELIPFDHYVTREELVSMTGLSDRGVRQAINRCRKSAPENVIISSSDMKGYKRPSTYKEIERCLDESRKRVKQEYAKQKQLLRLLRGKGQKVMGALHA